MAARGSEIFQQSLKGERRGDIWRTPCGRGATGLREGENGRNGLDIWGDLMLDVFWLGGDGLYGQAVCWAQAETVVAGPV